MPSLCVGMLPREVKLQDVVASVVSIAELWLLRPSLLYNQRQNASIAIPCIPNIRSYVVPF